MNLNHLAVYKYKMYEILYVEPFPQSTAITFFRHELQDGQEQKTADHQILLLAEKLGYLPLAIQQCVAYLKGHQMSIERYVHLFDKYIDTTLDIDLPKYGKTVKQ